MVTSCDFWVQSNLFERLAKTQSSTNEDPSWESSSLKDLVYRLPRHHFLTLALLMQHLRKVASHAEENNMPPSNLGIVFGPTLLRTIEGSASLSSLVDTVYQTKAIQLMIEHANQIFDFRELANLRESRGKITGRHSESSFTPGLVRSFSFIDRKKFKEIDIEKKFEHKQDYNEVEENTDNFHPLDTHRNPVLNSDSDPKIFKGSLKDYQGLEGLATSIVPDPIAFSSSIKSSKLGETTDRTPLTVDVNESFQDNFCMVLTEVAKIKSQRTESSADSDYSFDSHSSRDGNTLEREIEDLSNLYSSTIWGKKNSAASFLERKTTYNTSPQSSLSQSLDDSQGSEAVEECISNVVRKSQQE